ncbi:MAG: DUF2799 domain-containing protein [Comamonas sp.]
MGVGTITPMQARSCFSRAVVVAASAMLWGCSTMDAQECRDTDWAYLGQLDAMEGKQDLKTRAQRHFRTCKDQGAQMDARAYQQGWMRGLRDFCTPQSGKAYAEQGLRFQPGYCPAQLEAAFLEGYSPARERYDAQQSALELERRIEAKKKELREARNAKNSAGHIAYVQKDLRDLQLELVQLKLRLAQ